MQDTTALNDRIDSLEARLMHQEASIEELTRTLLEQERLLGRQTETILRLERQLSALAPGMTGTAAEEPPPPHY